MSRAMEKHASEVNILRDRLDKMNEIINKYILLLDLYFLIYSLYKKFYSFSLSIFIRNLYSILIFRPAEIVSKPVSKTVKCHHLIIMLYIVTF